MTFLNADVVSVPERRFTPAMTVSVAVHALAGLAIALVIQQQIAKIDDPPLNVDTVFLVPDMRPPSMGGGSPKPAVAPTTPIATVPQPTPVPTIVEEPAAIIPETDALPTEAFVAPGPPTAGASPSAGGAGNSAGAGVGNGPGSGFGGTVYNGGNGVSWPVPTRKPAPQYTAGAMRARLQGEVGVRCIVMPDGKCTDIKVTKSLDSQFGLDEKAIESAKQWQFRPGMRQGVPVPVWVDLIIEFNIR